MNSIFNSLIKSRRFWAAVALIVVPVLNEKFSFGLTEEQFITAAIAVVGWIVGESIRSSQAVTTTYIVQSELPQTGQAVSSDKTKTY